MTPLWFPDAAECRAQSSSSSGSSSSGVSDDSSTTASDSGTTAESADEPDRSHASGDASSSGVEKSQEKGLEPRHNDTHCLDNSPLLQEKETAHCPPNFRWTIQQAPKRRRKQERQQQNLVTSAGKQFRPITSSTNAKVSLFAQVQSEDSEPVDGHTLTKHLIGWLVWIKRSDDVLLIGELESEDDVLALKRHPVVAQLPQYRTRLCLLMLGWGLSEGLSDGVEQLQKALPHVRLAPSSSSNFFPSSAASARVTSRLALSSSVFFPLPHGLQGNESSPMQAAFSPEVLTGSCTLRWGLQSEMVEVALWSKKLPEDERRPLSIPQVQEQVLQERPGMKEQLLKLRTEQPDLFLEQYSWEDEGKGTGGSKNRTIEQGFVPPNNVPASNKSAAAALRARLSFSAKPEIQTRKPDNGDLGHQSIKDGGMGPGSRLITGDSAQERHGPSRQAPAILFLGTGCAEPSKYRAASAILVT